jgi:hypothetical protein
MTTIVRALALCVAFVLAAGCSEVPTGTLIDTAPDFAKGGGKGKPPSGTAVSVNITATSPGLLPDGGGAYLVTASPDGSVDVRPSCGSRTLDLQGMTAFIDGLDRSICNGKRGAGYMFLKFPGIMTASTGACPDLDAPEPTINALNFGVNSRFFFQVDTDDDGKYDDTMYTLVITDCLVAVELDGSRHVTATTGNLWEGQNGTGPVLAGVAINVDLTITQ